MSEKYIFGSKNNGNKILRNGGKILGYNIPNTAFAIYSADDNSLTFYYGIIPKEGYSYKGKTVTNVYTGFDSTTYSSYSSVPWYSNRANSRLVVFDKSFAGIQPIATAYWFCQMTNLAEITGLEYLDTSAVTTMHYMFYYCTKLTSLDVSGFDTANVTNMGCMFSGCSCLTSLDVSGFDTAKVTNMDYMFEYCDGLTSLDVSKFDTAAVTTMRYMFDSCSGLTSLDVSGFDTAKVTNMNNMFYGCSGLTTTYSDDANFVTSAVTSGIYMFTNCPKLVGGNGTAYSSSNVTYEMAHVDTEDNPGYFTAK